MLWSYSLLSPNLFALPLGANGFHFHSLWHLVQSSYLAQLYSFDLAWFYQSRLFHSFCRIGIIWIRISFPLGWWKTRNEIGLALAYLGDVKESLKITPLRAKAADSESHFVPSSTDYFTPFWKEKNEDLFTASSLPLYSCSFLIQSKCSVFVPSSF